MLNLSGGFSPLIPVIGIALVVLFLLLLAMCIHHNGAGAHEPDIERNYRHVGRNRVRWVHPWPLRAGGPLGRLHHNHRNLHGLHPLQAGHHHHHLHHHHHPHRHHHGHRAHR
ncbi:histidine-rich carboxyl terminus protein 1 [Sminthopsis crassicaudata]|uniref:histidine-rich carboxyl terminus protein 1 n=1 Tax=Sminthopsis crassicaudata TaxID=9301 RepID=UPI003D68E602